MKFTEGLVKTKKDVAKNLDSANAEFLIRGSYIEQVMAGVYNYLPLGLKVIRKIENIIREEMEAIGGTEILMPVLQPKENWEKTGRWEELDTLYRFESYYSKTQLVLGPTHEEIVVPLGQNLIQSYKDLPKYLYQIQTKFRDEKRAKGGLLRAREFIMKDLYSFHTDEKDLDTYYEKAKKAYSKIFDRVGLGNKTYLTFASGGTFSKYSHEYQTISENGEDDIFLCEKCKVAVNKEIIDEQNVCPECGKKDLKAVKAIEVGNIFKLRTKYSEKFDLKYTDEKGAEKLVEMGCYGIGVGRLMGTIVEVCHDERGIVWPETIAPYKIHLINLGEDQKVFEATKKLYDNFLEAGIDVIWDDRIESAGTKFADADLLGMPYRVIISEKTLAQESVELKERNAKEAKLIKATEVIKEIKGR